jgi:thymidylate synthase
MHLRNSVKDVRQTFIELKASETFVTDKTGVSMLEIVNASFVADEPAIFGTVNQDYVQRELAWYQTMSLNVNDIPGGPPAIWKRVADKDGYINSNYGWCIWSPDNGHQYDNVVQELRSHSDSRRAIMIYTNPLMWYKYNENGRSDFMCTNAVQYMIRDGFLHAVVQMRSNDVVFGYKNDYAWQSHVLDKLCGDLSVKRGLIHWNVGSLHVYEQHFDLVG